MNGLVDYSDSESEGSDGVKSTDPATGGAATEARLAASATRTRLPDANLLLSGSGGADVANVAGSKRPASQHHPPHRESAKASRTTTSTAPGEVRRPVGTMVPPQVAGKPNVATEDLASMFARRQHAPAR